MTLDATGSLRSLDFGTGTQYSIDEPGIAGLGNTIKSADTSYDGRDGSSGSTDWLDVQVFSIPIEILGDDADDAMSLLDDLLTAFAPCRDGVDVELALSLPGWGDRSWFGRPRGVEIDAHDLADGMVKALCRFDALEPNYTGS